MESKRKAEKNKKFDETFISFLDVYKSNDERAKIKLKINEILDLILKKLNLIINRKKCFE